MRFFDRLQELLGLKPDPEEQAKQRLAELAISAKQEAQAELKELKAAWGKVRTGLTTLQDTMAVLRESREAAQDACEVGWDEEEAQWDASLKDFATPVLERSAVAQAALEELERTTTMLGDACSNVEKAVLNRTKVAKAVVEGLDDLAKKRLALPLREASQPIDDGDQLRVWVLARAEVKDTLRQLRAFAAEAVEDPESLAGSLRERRASRCRMEVTRAAAAAAAAAQEPVMGTSKLQGDDQGSFVPFLLAAILLAASAFLVAGDGGYRGSLPEIPAMQFPSIQGPLRARFAVEPAPKATLTATAEQDSEPAFAPE